MNAKERAEIQDAAEDAARAGRMFAAHLRQFADDQAVNSPTLSTAMAIVLASLIVDLDSTGPRHDHARVAVFVDQVRASLREMRSEDWEVH